MIHRGRPPAPDLGGLGSCGFLSRAAPFARLRPEGLCWTQRVRVGTSAIRVVLITLLWSRGCCRSTQGTALTPSIHVSQTLRLPRSAQPWNVNVTRWQEMVTESKAESGQRRWSAPFSHILFVPSMNVGCVLFTEASPVSRGNPDTAQALQLLTG